MSAVKVFTAFFILVLSVIAHRAVPKMNLHNVTRSRVPDIHSFFLFGRRDTFNAPWFIESYGFSSVCRHKIKIISLLDLR